MTNMIPGGVWEGGHVNDDIRKQGVGKGWHPLLDELHEALMEVCPEYVTHQVKEKFGGLRAYIQGNEAAHEVEHEYEARSFLICESCGNPGRVRTSTSWYHTFCNTCEEAYLMERHLTPQDYISIARGILEDVREMTEGEEHE